MGLHDLLDKLLKESQKSNEVLTIKSEDLIKILNFTKESIETLGDLLDDFDTYFYNQHDSWTEEEAHKASVSAAITLIKKWSVE